MTARSTRKAAEMAVIDAASNWFQVRMKAREPGYMPGNMHILALERAVAELNALGLRLPDQPAYSNNSTDSSAAAPIKEKVGPDARRCFDEILLVWSGGGVGLTCDQVEMITGMTHQNASARINGLRDNGWIRDSGAKRKTRSRRLAIVWGPTTIALQQEGLA